ncbi:MAG TPA: MBL fold metallo-hydrolase [Candidatus Binatia bacterium]|jgi:flavorubredoxin|nr:MBL fold metallo-hydrolase [Candidatus Binatia bacterium]
MTITNRESGTRIDEIADGIYRISTPVPPDAFPGGFTFNQFLIDDDEPLLFHTGLRRMFPLVREAIASVLPVTRLRHLAFSHFEADECGALNELLAVAPSAAPLCGVLAADVSVRDVADRPPRTLADGEVMRLGRHEVRWLYTPHLPHAWECGYLFESRTGTLFCGDLFTQSGHEHVPITDGDILRPSEGMRAQMDYFAHAPNSRALLERLADLAPTTLACMHGASFRGDGAGQLRALADSLEQR